MDKFFKITERGSNYRKEIVGGLTTFFAMAYTAQTRAQTSQHLKLRLRKAVMNPMNPWSHLQAFPQPIPAVM